MAQLRRKAVPSSGKKMQNPIAKAMSRARHSSFYHDLSLRGDHPLRLLGTPKDIWPGSVTAGTQIVSGKIIAGGCVLENSANKQNHWPGDDIWLATDIGEGWLAYLHSFSWLKDLNQAVDRDGAKKRAEELIDSWINHNTQWGEVSWRADIVGERATNWLIYTPLIMDTDNVIYRGRVLDIMARSARHLMKLSPDFPDGPGGLKAIIALVLSGLFIPSGEGWLKEGTSQLKFALGREILVDGGIRTRNPQELLLLFMQMVLLKEAFVQVSKTVPEELNNAITRMASNLKSMIHGDGKLALFNGVIIQNHEDIYSALLKVELDRVAKSNLQQSGFCRVEKGKSLLIADFGPPAELELSRACHSGTHSFELSRATERFIVNCGDASFVQDKSGNQIDISARGTAAHSTLILEQSDSSVIRDDRFIGQGITKVENQTFEKEGHILIESAHDGYVERYEYLHKRLIYMSDAGEDIRGEDIIEHHKLSENGDVLSFDIRFHLHPDVSVTLSKDGKTVYIGLVNGETWQFKQRGAELTVEDSVYFGSAGKVSATKQVLLSGKTEGAITTILWSLRLE